MSCVLLRALNSTSSAVIGAASCVVRLIRDGILAGIIRWPETH